MGWEEVDGNTSNDNKVDFTKFAEGVTHIRVLDESPNVRWQHWMPQHGRGVNCPGKDCPICALRKSAKEAGEQSAYSMSKRFSINVLNRGTGKLEVLDQGRTFFAELNDFHKEEDIRHYDLKVKRKGMDTNTSYRIDKESTLPLTGTDKLLAEEVGS